MARRRRRSRTLTCRFSLKSDGPSPLCHRATSGPWALSTTRMVCTSSICVRSRSRMAGADLPERPAAPRPRRQRRPALGGGVAWKFGRLNDKRHRVKDASGMDLFDSGLRAKGGSYTRRFKIAGAFPWIDPVSGRRGFVRTRVSVTPASGPKTTVRWSLVRPRGCVFDVQVRKPGSTRFVAWKRGVTSMRAVFAPTRNGTFYFRARVRKPSRSASSGWSLARAFRAT